MNELISVVIPVYNVETYLDACVRSVMKQTYSNIEIILVDDGATDNSGEMCDFYAKEDSRVKVIHKDSPFSLYQFTSFSSSSDNLLGVKSAPYAINVVLGFLPFMPLPSYCS